MPVSPTLPLSLHPLPFVPIVRGHLSRARLLRCPTCLQRRRRILCRRLDRSHHNSSPVLTPATTTAQPGVRHHPAPAAPRRLRSSAISNATTTGRRATRSTFYTQRPQIAMASSDQRSIHVLLVPFPVRQGHINPLLQYGKRLASHSGVRCTLAATRFVVNSTKPTPSSVHVAVFSDGCDGGGPDELGGVGAHYFEQLESAGSKTLDELLRSESELGRPVHVVVYDAVMPWALGVARQRGAAGAAVPHADVRRGHPVRAHAWAGRLPPPPLLQPEVIRGLDRLSCQLEMSDMPTFLADTSYHPSFRKLLVNQLLGLDTADHVLVNSFYDLEPQEADYLASTWRDKMVGPTIPSAFLDNRLPDDVSYGIHLHTPMIMESKAWLDAQKVQSVLYVSFGSMASLDPDQMSEIAEGLYNSGKQAILVGRPGNGDCQATHGVHSWRF